MGLNKADLIYYRNENFDWDHIFTKIKIFHAQTYGFYNFISPQINDSSKRNFNVMLCYMSYVFTVSLRRNNVLSKCTHKVTSDIDRGTLLYLVVPAYSFFLTKGAMFLNCKLLKLENQLWSSDILTKDDSTKRNESDGSDILIVNYFCLIFVEKSENRNLNK